MIDKVPASSRVRENELTISRGFWMKPATMLIIGALIIALAVVGYLYYQRTRNDITIQLPKVGSIVDRNDLWHAA